MYDSLSWDMQAEAEPRAAKPVDDDEDIFGDAGRNYEPELPASKANSGATTAPTSGSYFDRKDDMSDLPALPRAGLHPQEIMTSKGSENLQGSESSQITFCSGTGDGQGTVCEKV